MSAPLDHASLTRSIAGTDFALARSRCIDAFAKLEFRVARAATRLKLTVNKESLGLRVAALAKATRGPALSAANEPKLAEWIEATGPLITKRAWLVHSVMELGEFEGEWKASFANVLDLVSGSQNVMLMSLADLRTLHGKVIAKAEELSTIVMGVTPRTKAQPSPPALP